MSPVTTPPTPAPEDEQPAARPAGPLVERYELLEQIGKGGVAVVHRAFDVARGRHVALKRLMASVHAASSKLHLFEREFETLSQLAHPRVVDVFDYHVDQDGPFYTMELLDGGDLHSLSPADFRHACLLMRDVCSALCLIHSRRFTHRDISPRNIPCTQDGLAKLIDFGAMLPMGTSAPTVGTPPFCAPEVVDMLPLDARSDLYSLGTTLYFLLTGRHAYPARSFRQLQALWDSPPASPSQIVDGIPATLDNLVMDLIQVDPTQHPTDAAEVMERLSAIAGVELDEQLMVSQAYLSTPTLVGRDRNLEPMRRRLATLKRGEGGSVLVEADGGLGRTRLLDACALEARLFGFTVARASAADAACGDYGAVVAIGRQLLDAHPKNAGETAAPHAVALAGLFPELCEPGHEQPSGGTLDEGVRLGVQSALTTWLLDMSRHTPLVLLVDDVDRLDQPSAASIALVAHHAADHAISIVATARPPRDVATDPALRLLGQLSSRLTLNPLSLSQVAALLGSVFGKVPHLRFVAERLPHL